MENFGDKYKQGVGIHYSGPERRKMQRRQSDDRRDSIRLELDKPPRRSGKDRRSHQYLWNMPQGVWFVCRAVRKISTGGGSDYKLFPKHPTPLYSLLIIMDKGIFMRL